MEIIAKIESFCSRNTVSIAALFRAANIDATQYWRWKSGKFEPRQASIRSLEKTMSDIDAAAARKPSNIETVYECTNTLPSGFEINFTVGKIKPKRGSNDQAP